MTRWHAFTFLELLVFIAIPIGPFCSERSLAIRATPTPSLHRYFDCRYSASRLQSHAIRCPLGGRFRWLATFYFFRLSVFIRFLRQAFSRQYVDQGAIRPLLPFKGASCSVVLSFANVVDRYVCSLCSKSSKFALSQQFFTMNPDGSSAGAIILGRDGNDAITGSNGRDLLIGGKGKDNLRGSGDEDILIGGVTQHDMDLTGLLNVMTEWREAGSPLLARIQHLQGIAGGGANGGYLLIASSISNDNIADQLFGDAGDDWFLFASSGRFADLVLDPVSGEVLTGI